MQNLGALGIGVAALTITLVVVFLIMAEAKTTMEGTTNIGCDNNGTTNDWYLNASQDVCCMSGSVNCLIENQSYRFSNAFNATSTLQNSTATLPNWVSIIIITAIGSLLIGMVAMFRRS